MSTNTALDQIKNRIEGLSNLCPEYMHLAIRNSVRNCDFDCQAHGEEEDCGPGQSDGARIAHSLADVPKLLAALEAVEARAILAENTLSYGAGGVLMAEAIRAQIEEALS